MMDTGTDKIVSASDVEKYGYCPLSWWLSEQKASENDDELRIGSEKHAAIGKDVKKISLKEKFSKESERSVLWFSLIAIVIGINGVAIIYQTYASSDQGEAIMTLLSIIAVLWIVVAAMFFYMGIKRQMRIKPTGSATTGHEGTMGNGRIAPDPKEDIDWRRRFTEAKWSTLLFFIVSGILAMHGVVILLNLGQIQSQILSRTFLVLALVWLIGSSFFYYTSLKRHIVSRDQNKVDSIEGGGSFFSDSEISVILFAVVATILATSSLTIFQNPHTHIGRILLIVAVLWLYGAFIFLYRALRANMRQKLLILDKLKEAESIQISLDMADEPELKAKIQKEIMDYERRVIWFAAIAIILALNAIIMNFSKSLQELYGTLIAYIFEIVALVWLMGALFFLYMVLRSSRIAARLREVHGIKEGTIEYVDALEDGSKMLVSGKYGLRGRPDYILKSEENLVPVEVKTGRVPRGPLFSHILQLAVYCLLIEDKYDSTPSYGIIRYGDVQHKVDYTEELKDILLSKLDDMKKVIESGEAHRNHNRPSKCKWCSRRKMCPERLD